MLCIIKNDGADGVFEPEVLRVLVAAFEEAWQRLEKHGIRFASNYQREQARNTLGTPATLKVKATNVSRSGVARISVREGFLLHFY